MVIDVVHIEPFEPQWQVEPLKGGEREGSTATAQTVAAAKELHHDHLVYIPKVPECAENALALGTEQTAPALREQLPRIAKEGRMVLVCGGGLTGMKTATELAETYPSLMVTLLTSGTFGEQLSRRAQQYLRHTFAKLGIHIIDNHAVTQIYPAHVECDTGTTLPFDICIWAGNSDSSPSESRMKRWVSRLWLQGLKKRLHLI